MGLLYISLLLSGNNLHRMPLQGQLSPANSIHFLPSRTSRFDRSTQSLCSSLHTCAPFSPLKRLPSPPPLLGFHYLFPIPSIARKACQQKERTPPPPTHPQMNIRNDLTSISTKPMTPCHSLKHIISFPDRFNNHLELLCLHVSPPPTIACRISPFPASPTASTLCLSSACWAE